MARTSSDRIRLSCPEGAPLPQAGLAAGTRILTLDGMIPVEFLEPGDRVVTREGVRELRRVGATLRDGVEACRIRASSLGHGRPELDITVTAETPVFLSDWRAKALYGQDHALVAAGRLADGEFIVKAGTRAAMRVFTLAFDTPQIVYAEGVEVAAGVLADATA